jgi:hypothetical protein
MLRPIQCKMKKRLLTSVFTIGVFLLMVTCATIKIAKQGDGSILAISAKSSGIGLKGLGIELTLVNIDTQENFVSKSLSPLSPHSIIQNISPGTYYVRQIKVPLGNITYTNRSDSVRSFFGQLIIESNTKYYLGSYTGTRKVGDKNAFFLKLSDQSVPKDIIDRININTGWENGDYIKLCPADNKELIIY